MKSIIAWTVHNTPAMNVLVFAVMIDRLDQLLLDAARGVSGVRPRDRARERVVYPGATPEEVEEGICQKVEEACRSVVGIKKITSIAREGMGFCVFEMNDNVQGSAAGGGGDPLGGRANSEHARNWPRIAKVEQVTLRDAGHQGGRRWHRPSPAATSGRSSEMRDVAERVRDDLLALPTVSAANIGGGKDYEITIEISEDTLRKHGLTLKAVADIVRK